MKTLLRISLLLMVTSLVFIACQKEVSLEKGNTTASVGSLSVDGSGNCMGAVVSGNYYKDTLITSSNYVDVSVQVDTAGTYTISSDTVNGYYFKATGTFGATGTQVVRLVGGGKPLAVGTNIFTVTYNGTTCEFTVTVTAPAGGGGSAAFTVDCAGAVPAGIYKVGVALTSANTMTLNVNVTTIGTWSISTGTPVNGVSFSGSGTFTTTGVQTIVLTGSGTPAAAGLFNFPVTVGTTSCNFQVTFTSDPDYFPRTNFSNWSYQYDGDPADSSLTKVIAQTHSAMGNTYNIFMYSYDVAADGFDTLGYYRRSGGNYYEWGDISWGILDNPIRSEYIFLKDDQSVGSTWSSAQFTGPYTNPTTGSTSNITLRWVMTIQQQNQTVTVGATSYPNTILVKQELQQMGSTGWQTAFYLDNFYARDKGLIKLDLYAFDQASGSFDLFYEQDVRRLVIY